jgi:hypothetical protein
MDKNKMNLEVAKVTSEILSKRTMGLQARIEGVTAHISHPDTVLSLDTIPVYLAELEKIIQQGKELMSEYDELALWVKENLPENTL